MAQLLVVAPQLPDDSFLVSDDGSPVLTDEESKSDAIDLFNHPRLRRALILQRLQAESCVIFHTPQEKLSVRTEFASIHSEGLLDFLETAWGNWVDMGEIGRDHDFIRALEDGSIPNLIPGCYPLPRDPYQEPSFNVMGQVGYYCTDDCTPIIAPLWRELETDTAIVAHAVDQALEKKHATVYAIPTHPGHHAAQDSFGGYCYLNQAAHAVKRFQTKLGGDDSSTTPIAVIDVDYHCGNGTASIFYSDPSVFVVSIHCDPNYDYPYYSGFAHQKGVQKGLGKTLHLPLPPKTKMDEYKVALQSALEAVSSFGPRAAVVSMGLDTHDADPCALRRAGFCLSGEDYRNMGHILASMADDIPVLFLQEGGYKMDSIAEAATNVLMGFREKRSQ